ncbi:M36 family metallopeptidase [Streptomyces sp. NBC_01013]|uniref:M36 family metallopeptidase n=1 Tax=Streptomyces sp. NBC_01013 TaxID=2903718 RepID=UPI00386ABFFF|nr:M36 family metallopeptidase [Streptomyces sp. NBC_01013]
MAVEVDLRDSDAYFTFTARADDLPLGVRRGSGSRVEQALEVARFTTETLGVNRSQPLEFVPLPEPPPTSAGASTIHLAQQRRGILVFQAVQSVRISPLGEVQRTQARLVGRASTAEVSIQVPVETAVHNATIHVSTFDDDSPDAEDLFGLPKVLARFTDLADQPTVLQQGPTNEPIMAQLTWIPTTTELRLAWDITLGISELQGAFRVAVDAGTGAILYSSQLVASAACRGNVYRADPDLPRTLVDFPLGWQSYDFEVPADLPPAPPDWVADRSTAGYAATAGVGSSGAPLDAGPTSSLIFDPAEAEGEDQMVLNAFFGTCFMHDLTYLLGFREADGSYQDGAVGVAGILSKRVNVEIRKEPILGTAHWWPLGSIPTMRLGPKSETGRHTALDMSIIFHEYLHGVSTRLVSGGTTKHPLQEAQSRGMGEGWGDYFSCMLLNTSLIGGWVSNDNVGLRRFPYDEHFPADQINFAGLGGLGLYEIGSLWCATLLEMTRRIGRDIAVHLVIEGMKGLAANPSLLDGRDEILLVLDDLRDSKSLSVAEHAAAEQGVWGAFAAFGMGANASSQGPSVAGAIGDNLVP